MIANSARDIINYINSTRKQIDSKTRKLELPKKNICITVNMMLHTMILVKTRN